MTKEKNGLFIALEGPDGSGKSTQTRLLSEWLNSEGYKVVITKEPTDNPIGKIIRKTLAGEIEMPVEAEALLFAGDRILHVDNVIIPGLRQGKIVLTSRYIHSSLVYQSSRGLDQEWIEKINKAAIPPDLTIFIDVPPKVGSERINSSGYSDRFERNLNLQKRVREAYRKLAQEKEIKMIDGTLPKEQIQKMIQEEVKKLLHANLSRER